MEATAKNVLDLQTMHTQRQSSEQNDPGPLYILLKPVTFPNKQQEHMATNREPAVDVVKIITDLTNVRVHLRTICELAVRNKGILPTCATGARPHHTHSSHAKKVTAMLEKL